MGLAFSVGYVTPVRGNFQGWVIGWVSLVNWGMGCVGATGVGCKVVFFLVLVLVLVCFSGDGVGSRWRGKR